MKIIVKAKASAKVELVEPITQGTFDFGDQHKDIPIYKVSVKEPPVHGKSNAAICRALAEYFQVPLLAVTLISGRAGKQKIFDIQK